MLFLRRLPVVPALVAIALAMGGPLAGAEFLRGDSNEDGVADLSDAVCALMDLFLGGCGRGICPDALDSNDDGAVDVSDPVRLLNHLFLGAPSLPEPFALGCGRDPTPDGLGCDDFLGCGGDTIVLTVPAGVTAYTIWSERFNSAPDQHAVHAEIRFRPGSYRVRRAGGHAVPNGLVEELRTGPAMAAAEDEGDGFFSLDPEDEERPLVYRQSFRQGVAVWTIVLRYGPREENEDVVDCGFFDPCGDFSAPRAALRAEVDDGAGARTVHTSCFCAGDWTPVRGHPGALTLEDGTRLELRLEESYLFRGVAGETSNRRLAGAVVELAGGRLEVSEYERLVYAAFHHNGSQELRVLLDPPVDGVHGVDLVECPPPNFTPAFCWFDAESARAHLLGPALDRGPPLRLTAIEDP